jgi:hypothetical protein
MIYKVFDFEDCSIEINNTIFPSQYLDECNEHEIIPIVKSVESL